MKVSGKGPSKSTDGFEQIGNTGNEVVFGVGQWLAGHRLLMD
ncbi:hypothetical protein [Aureliella helgolandensis]|nr:hypothetical protein [Aureliella helgolandensis]